MKTIRFHAPPAPPPMPSWADLITNVPVAPEVVPIDYAQLPCNRCGTGIRAVYTGGTIEAYCREGRKAANKKSYEGRAKRDIKLGAVEETPYIMGATKRGPTSLGNQA